MQEHLTLLQTMRFKGRATPDVLLAATGMPLDDVMQHLQTLLGSGYCQEATGRYRLTPAGREQLDHLLQAERQGLNTATLAAQYENFVPLNGDYKQLIHAWQIREGKPNDHTDADYDGTVIDNICALHERFKPLLDVLVDEAPRLAPYPARFTAALDKVRGGDTSWLTKPMIDSHHTVWFELHEDLIGLAGHTRQAEAEAGRAD